MRKTKGRLTRPVPLMIWRRSPAQSLLSATRALGSPSGGRSIGVAHLAHRRGGSHGRWGRGLIRQVLHQDALHLADRQRVLLHVMAGVDHHFGLHPVEVSAGVGHDPVGRIGSEPPGGSSR